MKTLFVSSTFMDMHYERDAIREVALPKLNAIAAGYGQTLSFCDLRWGINTLDLDGEEGSKKVLDVCLDQIDRCAQPMIVLLGDRYGYIPDRELITSAAARKQLQLRDLEISVTALEIEYGVMSKRKNAFFYFRESVNAPTSYLAEDEAHAKKLAELKARIKNIAGDNLRFYSADFSSGKPDLGGLCDMIVSDIADYLSPEWKSKATLTPFELDRATQWDFITERSEICRGREKFVADILSEIEKGTRVNVKGKSGSGKSVVFSRTVTELKARGYDVLPFVGGLTTESNDALDIIRNTYIYLQNKLYGTPTDKCEEIKEVPALRRKCAELIHEYIAAGHRFVIALDAVDQLYSDELRNSNGFIPDVYEQGFTFFSTCTDEFTGLDAGSIAITELSRDEKKSVIDGIMGSYGRELDRVVKNDMVELPSSGSPLYLSFLVKRLLMMNKDDFDIISSFGGQMDAICARQREIIASCPSDTDEMCALLLSEAGMRINPELVHSLLNYLACSRYGLRESDFAALIPEWNTLDFLHFVMYLGDCFILRDDGRYDFSHKSIRAGILKTADVKPIHAKIAEYFSTLSDGVAQNETLYHIMSSDNSEFFRRYIIDNFTDSASLLDTERMKNLLLCTVECAADDADWIVGAIDSTPVQPENVPFLSLMSSFAALLIESYGNAALGTKISEAIAAVAQRFVDGNIADSENVLNTAMLLSVEANLVFGDGTGSNAMQSLSRIYDRFKAQKSDGNAYMLLVSVRLSVVAFAQTRDPMVGELMFDANDEVACYVLDRFEAEKNEDTARNMFVYFNTEVIISMFQGDFETASERVDDCFEILDGYLELFNPLNVRTVFQFFNAIGVSLINMLTSMYSTRMQHNSVPGDDSMLNIQDFNDEMMPETVPHGFMTFEAEDEVKDAYELLKKIFEGLLDYADGICEPCGLDKDYFIALIDVQLSSGALFAGEPQNAEKYKEDATRRIQAALEKDCSIEVKQLSIKIRSMNISFMLNRGERNFDYLIPLARDLAADAQNFMSANNYSGFNYYAEAMIAVINTYYYKYMYTTDYLALISAARYGKKLQEVMNKVGIDDPAISTFLGSMELDGVTDEELDEWEAEYSDDYDGDDNDDDGDGGGGINIDGDVDLMQYLEQLIDSWAKEEDGGDGNGDN